MKVFWMVIVGVAFWRAYVQAGALFCFVILLAIALLLKILQFDNEIAERNPRWLGSGPSDFAPPDPFNIDPQAVVEKEAQKVTKTDEEQK